jgi:two-component system, OmpR family, KDP operon response regulator KdpE
MSDNPALVMVVDDEAQIRRLLQIALQSSGYRVTLCGSGAEAMTAAVMERPDLVILDLGLGDMDGLDVLRRLREWSAVPVIILTVRNDESDKVALLDGGADDFLTKPFSTGELLARIRTALRHATLAGEEPVFHSGLLRVDLAKRTVALGEETVHLTATEYRLLQLFVRNAGKVLTHRQIMKEVWGPHLIEETQYLRVYMAQLRRKLRDDPTSPTYFLTEPGVGYRLLTDER